MVGEDPPSEPQTNFLSREDASYHNVSKVPRKSINVTERRSFKYLPPEGTHMQ